MRRRGKHHPDQFHRPRYRRKPPRRARAKPINRIKSLLLLFFRREESSFLKERSKELFYYKGAA